jgi:hypothetical protein
MIKTPCTLGENEASILSILCAAASSLPLVKFILARFYQNVSEVVYEGYKAR